MGAQTSQTARNLIAFTVKLGDDAKDWIHWCRRVS